MDQTQTYADNQTLVAYFDSPDRAQRAIEELQQAGFSSAHLGIAHRGGAHHGAASSAVHKTENAAHNMWEKVKDFFEGRSPENYADERTRGDFGTREITDPGVSTNAAYGTSSDYTHHDLHHSLTGMNVPEHRSRYFSGRLDSSEDGCVLTVNAGSRFAEAERIVRENGGDLGENASDASYASSPGYAGSAGRDAVSGYDRNLDRGTASDIERGVSALDRNQNRNPDRNVDRDTRAGLTDSDERTVGRTEGLQNIQLLGEVLRVHKDRLSRGEVVVRKDIITETQTVQVPVVREELVVEQHDVAGDIPSRGVIGENKEIRIPLTEETASIDKGTVVRQEVAVGKKPVQEVRELSGEVRREELVVDDQTQRRAVNE